MVFKNYVDRNYPDKVALYTKQLKMEKEQKIQAVEKNVFIQKNLMWQDQSVNTTLLLNPLELKIYCRKLQLAKRDDWRVPRYAELISLVNYKQKDPAAFDAMQFISGSKYWSATPSVKQKDHNWFVDFKHGLSDIGSDLKRYNIRCVREISQEIGRY